MPQNRRDSLEKRFIDGLDNVPHLTVTEHARLRVLLNEKANPSLIFHNQGVRIRLKQENVLLVLGHEMRTDWQAFP